MIIIEVLPVEDEMESRYSEIGGRIHGD